MNKENIIKYYQQKHREAVEKTGQKIPQTIEAQMIRKALRIIEWIEK